MFNKIMVLYPTAVNLVDFKLQDNSDGKGPFISYWDTAKLGAKPTQAELDAVAIQAKQLENMTAIRAERDILFKQIDIDIKNGEDGEPGYDLPTLRARRKALRRVPQNFPNADIATFDWSKI